MSRTRRIRALALGVSLCFATLLGSSPAHADLAYWQISVVNNTGKPANDIEVNLGAFGPGIMATYPVTPSDASLTTPFDGTLSATWQPAIGQGQSFVADVALSPFALDPFLSSGTWTFNASPVGTIDPEKDFTITRISGPVPEPASIAIWGLFACYGAVGPYVRRRRIATRGR